MTAFLYFCKSLILTIILLTPGIGLCNDGTGETISTPAETPSPFPPPVEGGGIISAPSPPSGKDGEGPGEGEANEDSKEPPAAPTPVEPASKEPHFENIYTLDISGKFQDMKVYKDSPKAIEFRTIPEGAYIDKFLFMLGDRNQEVYGTAGKIYPMTNLYQDGYWNLNYRRYGLLDVETGLNKFIRTYNGYGTTTTDSSNIFMTRDINNLSVKFTPGDKLIITTKLSVEERNGVSPITFESFTQLPGISPTAIIERTEPKDYQTTTIGVNMEYIDDSINIQLDNNFRIFSNRLTDEVTWKNPYNGSDGRAKVADDYTVHTLTIRPSIKLTNNITSYNTLSYSKVTSTMDLIPFTTIPGVGDEFLRDKIDSDVRNLTLSSTLSAKILSNLKLNIKYRHYAYKNDTPIAKETPSYVMIDGGTGAKRYTRIPRYTAYFTDSILFDSTWSPASRLFLNTVLENKDTSRDEREVAKENEKKAAISLHSTIFNSLSAKLGYSYARRTGNYDPTYYNSVYDPDPLNTITQHTLFRSFDLSERDSQNFSATIDYFPIEAFTLGLNIAYNSEIHNNVSLGRESSKETSGSVYLQIVPFSALQLYSEYYYDKREITGRYTWTYYSNFNKTSPEDPKNPGFTKPVTGVLIDTSNVLITGFNFEPGKRFSVRGKYSKYDFTGTDTKLPEVSNITDTYEAYISAKLGKVNESAAPSDKNYNAMSITAGYYMERYVRSDYTLDNIPPATGTDKFLGIREPSYKYRLISLYLSVYF